MASLQHEYPAIEDVLSRLGGGAGDLDASISVAVAASTLLGWTVFAPFLRQALDLDSLDDDQLHTRLEQALARVIGPFEKE